MQTAVRTQYETIAEEITSANSLPRPEAVLWPHSHRLCYPCFKARHDDGDILTNRELLWTGPDGGQCLQEKQSLNNIPLPEDKKSLLELRRQLYMELVWLKQAIRSRQQVCMLMYAGPLYPLPTQTPVGLKQWLLLLFVYV